MALKIVLLALLVYCAASEAQSQGDDTSLPLSYNATELQGDGATCMNEQLLLETVKGIRIELQNLLQNSVLPFVAAPSEMPTPAPTDTSTPPDTAPLPQCPCISGGGTRIANLNMTDPNQQCPPKWALITSPVRTCGRTSTGSNTCDSVTFPVNGASYSRVCGRVRAYQVGQPNGFYGYSQGRRSSIDNDYVVGISITHGSSTPRQHVWTFAAAFYENYNGRFPYICPCTNTRNRNAVNFQIPPFVDNDYFCDTGAETNPSGTEFFPDDPLWDGEGCGPTSTCCELNNPPWFCKQLPAPTSDDIEVRICANNGIRNENIAIEQIEIYV